MIDPDEFYREIERKRLVNPLRSTGETENSFWQSVGRIYNMEIPTLGKKIDEVFNDTVNIMTGQKKHGFEQNKKTQEEKLAELGVKNAGR